MALTNLLRRGVAMLDALRNSAMSDQVTYQRGAAEIQIAATLGRSDAQQLDRSGALLDVRSDDFVISVADLVLDGAATTPLAGDRITATVGGQTVTYEVRPLGNEPAWRYTDAYQVAYRVHTKLISAA